MLDLLIVIMGIFVVTAFSVVITVLIKESIPIGTWALIAAVGAFITLAEISFLTGSEQWHVNFIILALACLFIIALNKYWEAIKLSQGK